MRELSVFVDESGDFGEYEKHSPFYIVALVLHDQAQDIAENVERLEEELANIGFAKHCVHSGPIVRQEEEYVYSDLSTRQKIVKRLMAFARQTDISCHSFYIEKKHLKNELEETVKLSKLLSAFIKDNYTFFLSFDVVKIYYDNGQVELTKILASVFNTLLDNVEFRRVIPSNYRLFQVADLVCTLKLAELKCNSSSMSKSEAIFFESERVLKKNYIKPIKDKNYGLVQ